MQGMFWKGNGSWFWIKRTERKKNLSIEPSTSHQLLKRAIKRSEWVSWKKCTTLSYKNEGREEISNKCDRISSFNAFHSKKLKALGGQLYSLFWLHYRCFSTKTSSSPAFNSTPLTPLHSFTKSNPSCLNFLRLGQEYSASNLTLILPWAFRKALTEMNPYPRDENSFPNARSPFFMVWCCTFSEAERRLCLIKVALFCGLSITGDRLISSWEIHWIV